MKKVFYLVSIVLGGVIVSESVVAQAIRDRNVIPVAVNLNEVLRMTITNGGNIEFVFNSIDDYQFGLSADAANLDNPADVDVIAGGAAANPATTTGDDATNTNGVYANNFYRSDFTVAGSLRWRIDWGLKKLRLLEVIILLIR